MESKSKLSVSTDKSKGTAAGVSLHLHDLPSEILQQIFAELDCKTLITCKRVCEDWRYNVELIEQKPKFWFNGCHKDFPPWVLLDLLDNIFPSHWKDPRIIDWKEIYKCASLWKRLIISEKSVTKARVVGGLDGISKLKVAGKWLLISTSIGEGKFFAQCIDQTDSLIELFVGGGAILDFELVNSDGRPVSNLVFNSPVLENVFETLNGYNEIWLELDRCYVQMGKTYCHNLDKIQQKVGHSYGYQAKLVCKNNRSSLIVKKKCNKIEGPEFMEIELFDPYSHIVDFWKHKVAVERMTSERQLYVDAISIDRKSQTSFQSRGIEFTVRSEINFTYSWQASLFIIFTNRRRISIAYNSEVIEQETPVRKGYVSSVLFYANHLFLGTDRGNLMIYKVQKPKDCLEIRVYETPCWDIHVCYGIISNIAIIEPPLCKGSRPVIVCGTPEEVYFVTLHA